MVKVINIFHSFGEWFARSFLNRNAFAIKPGSGTGGIAELRQN